MAKQNPSPTFKQSPEGELRYLYLRWLLLENLIRSIELYAMVGGKNRQRRTA
ncbi:MAG: hypothetical protein RMK57_00065 [Bryobacterales bacterium]|nr:hypothetical protein [Bryobacteraceae bacterium]MDW8352900.1 hypothetical protein [Bryobacterales bacterium]